ncbi:beta-propeller fold lactonase family protein, partial [Nocardioides daejeonensis]|uniref:beta-propeller fold lactonase family protein n=1 Tax=Nocardioides daejeonensis TaxID=1046556 RepID=UPI000D74EECF
MSASPLARRTRRPVALLASVALLATGAAALSASSTAANAAEGDSPARTELGFSVTTKTSIAGQYQIAASDDTGDLFVTSAQGRPPVTVATLARINPATLEVEQTAELPKLKHGAEGAQTKWLSTHGIYVDDTHDNVWVTNTRDNQVSVFDQDSLEYVAGTYDFDLAEQGTITQVAISHPREVVIDEVRNLAYVTAANRGGAAASAVTVYSTDVEAGEVLTPLKQITIPARADYPVAGEDAYAVTMGLEIDEATGKVYTNDFRADQYYVIDPTNDFSLETHAIPNATVATDGLGSLQPSSIAIDPGAGEIYSVNQTQGTNPASLQVFDLATNELKYSVETGPRALAVDVDRDRGLVYVADFANGSVTVVDARNGGEVIETVAPQGITKSANHLVVAGGSAYMVDKAGATSGTVDYAVNLETGATETRETTIDSITKITPAAEAEVVADARVGGKISLKGEGWFNQAGTSGSTVAVKIDRGAVPAPGGGDVWATIEAEDDGTFAAAVALPAGSIAPGTHTLNLLSGSLQEGDTVRSVPVEVEVLPAQKITNKKKPVIKGKTKVGKKLKVAKGTWSTSDVTLKYQWLRNGKAIKKATKATYKVTKADKGKKL